MKFLFLSAAALTLLAQPEPPLPPKAPKAPSWPKEPKFADGFKYVEPGAFAIGKFPSVDAGAFAMGKFPPGAAFALQGGRDRAESEADREYERGIRAIDKRQWDVALNHFQEIASLGKYRADAALYWKALALIRLARPQEAGAALDTLSKTYAQSSWAQEGQKLRSEVNAKPLTADEEEIKLAAMNSLMHSDSDRAVPLLEKMLERRSSPQIQERALQLLTQSNASSAREVVVKIAKGGGNPSLQGRAIRHLASHNSPENLQILGDVYRSAPDASLKRLVLRGYMSFGERDRLFAVAKSDTDPAMRREAIQMLGGMGAHTQLAELYGSESSTEVRASIMRGMMAAGSSSKLIEIAKGEKDPALSEMAIQHLGGIHSAAASEALASMYQSGATTEVRRRILRSLAAQNSAKQLIDVAKNEKDPDLRRQAVQYLTHMRSPEATAYLMELLK
ncbi:MAG: HEAT repeat domain-containing protein [Acidobacteria bacterium]|nr:HEAT repeat domain-containing protein [Acidobacteriota bacterium]